MTLRSTRFSSQSQQQSALPGPQGSPAITLNFCAGLFKPDVLCGHEVEAASRRLCGNGGILARLRRRLALAAVAVVLVSSPSYADVFDFSYNIAGDPANGIINIMASGELTANATAAPGEFMVTSITGTRNGEPITGLLPVGGLFNDNLIFTTDPHVDSSGLGYTVAGSGDNGLGDVTVFNVLGAYLENDTGGNFSSSFTLTPEAVATPLLAGLPLFATGLGALGLLGWCRKRQANASMLGAT